MEGIPALAVIVGQNNTGKSAILHAAALPKYGEVWDPALPIGQPGQLVYGNESQGMIELEYQRPAGRSVIVRFSFGTQRITSRQGQNVPAGEDPAKGVFYFSALRQPVPNFNYQRFTRDVGIRGEETWNILHQLKANDEEEFPIILDWAKQFGMGISSIGTPTAGPGSGQTTLTTYGYRTNLILHGSGVWSVLPIIVQGVLCRPGETLLIEEPESHLHRGAIDALWGFFADCASRDVQVICTTHSLDLVASMSERVEKGKVQADSALYLMRRDESSNITIERKDTAVFRNIREVIKKELAAHGL